VARWALVVWAVWATAACAHYTRRPRAISPGDYTLGPGDVIELKAFGETEIVYTGPIAPTGEVGLPLVGSVRLMGETIEGAREKLNAMYAAFLKDVNVFFAVKQFRSDFVHVMGEVRSPGTYPMVDGFQTTAISAVQGAGSFDPITAAFWDVRVVRGALERPEVYRVDIEALLEGDVASDARDLPLEPGDIVYVPPRWVTEVDRFLRQLLSPVGMLAGATLNTVAGVNPVVNPRANNTGNLGGTQ
jgi:polysaccharide export outer membrane protein